MDLTEVLNRLECIDYDVRIKISETTGEIKEEAYLDHEALLLAIELVEKEVNDEQTRA